MIILGLFNDFFCSTAIRITDLSSLLLCLEQLSSFCQGIHQNFGGRGNATSQEITAVILLDFACEKLSASLHYSPLVFNIRPEKQMGNLRVFSLLVSENLEVRPVTWCEVWLDMGAGKKQGRSVAMSGGEQNAPEQCRERTTEKAGVSPDSLCLSGKSSRCGR